MGRSKRARPGKAAQAASTDPDSQPQYSLEDTHTAAETNTRTDTDGEAASASEQGAESAFHGAVQKVLSRELHAPVRH